MGMGDGVYLSLNQFSIFVFFLGEFRVDILNNPLERSKLHHSIRNLSPPKRLKPLIQPTINPLSQKTPTKNAQDQRLPGWGDPYPAMPSVDVTLFQPSRVPLAKGGIVVCMRTLIASQGQRRTSAMSSAEAEAAR